MPSSLPGPYWLKTPGAGHAHRNDPSCNLNGRAVAFLPPELGRIEADVDRLVRMEVAIREAEAFIRRLEAA
ncbi:DUF2959 family protein [Desulfuromonas sp. TF]|uniref:DUF2959 family protein n=1 Tax=Desulfuromonas sp. TF TaxID=1232410 RepID=UPI000421374E|nr:DUF2959 family protein [Desulfuromonas sp. TF]